MNVLIHMFNTVLMNREYLQILHQISTFRFSTKRSSQNGLFTESLRLIHLPYSFFFLKKISPAYIESDKEGTETVYMGTISAICSL